VQGRNSKGQFPHRVAATLFLCHALLTGEFPHLMTTLRFKSNCAPRLQRVSGGAFLSGIFGGRAEFDLWLLENHPAAKLEDFELGSSLAETAGYPSALAQRADLSGCHVKGARKVADEFSSSISEQVLLQSAISLKGAQNLHPITVPTNGY
jgi:hypothetical protein